MSWVLIAHASIGATNSAFAAGPTTAVDTTGADLIVIGASHYQNGATHDAGPPTDSKSNSWTQAATNAQSTNRMVQMWWTNPSSVGSGHTFTLPAGAGLYQVLTMAAFSGCAQSSPVDGTPGVNHDNAGAANLIASLTPSVDGDLLVSVYASDSQGTSEIRDDGGNTTWGNLPGAASVTPTEDIPQDATPVHVDGCIAFRVLSGGNGVSTGAKWHNFPNESAAMIMAFKLSASGAVYIPAPPVQQAVWRM